MGVFLKKHNVMIIFFQKVAVVLAKKRQFSRQIFWQKYF
jgi:hypothetical protein